jgi:hypothetical protein
MDPTEDSVGNASRSTAALKTLFEGVVHTNKQKKRKKVKTEKGM